MMPSYFLKHSNETPDFDALGGRYRFPGCLGLTLTYGMKWGRWVMERQPSHMNCQWFANIVDTEANALGEMFNPPFDVDIEPCDRDVLMADRQVKADEDVFVVQHNGDVTFRSQSFEGFPLVCGENTHSLIRSLCASGYAWTRFGDVVECVTCHQRLGRFKEGDSAESIDAQFPHTCKSDAVSYGTGTILTSKPLQTWCLDALAMDLDMRTYTSQDGVVTFREMNRENIRHPAYSTFTSRLVSYDSRQGSNASNDVKALFGYFRSPITCQDTCYYCGEELCAPTTTNRMSVMLKMSCKHAFWMLYYFTCGMKHDFSGVYKTNDDNVPRFYQPNTVSVIARPNRGKCGVHMTRRDWSRWYQKCQMPCTLPPSTCINCKDGPVTTILNCGHLVLCGQCATNANCCPVCFLRVNQRIYVFFV